MLQKSLPETLKVNSPLVYKHNYVLIEKAQKLIVNFKKNILLVHLSSLFNKLFELNKFYIQIKNFIFKVIN